MADAAKPKREKQPSINRLDGSWSKWKHIVAPGTQGLPTNRATKGQMNELVVAGIPCDCGVYELKVDKVGKSYVVYIGSTCRGRWDRRRCPCIGTHEVGDEEKRCSLRRRITEYATNGSHKSKLIDRAITKGFSLCVRYLISENAQELENEYLARYDYAWNERNNGQIRNVFQAGQ